MPKTFDCATLPALAKQGVGVVERAVDEAKRDGAALANIQVLYEYIITAPETSPLYRGSLELLRRK